MLENSIGWRGISGIGCFYDGRLIGSFVWWGGHSADQPPVRENKRLSNRLRLYRSLRLGVETSATHLRWVSEALHQ